MFRFFILISVVGFLSLMLVQLGFLYEFSVFSFIVIRRRNKSRSMEDDSKELIYIRIC
jgi:hypothetical protein